MNFVNSEGKKENILTFYGSSEANEMNHKMYQHLLSEKFKLNDLLMYDNEIRIGYTLTKRDAGIEINIGVRISEPMMWSLYNDKKYGERLKKIRYDNFIRVLSPETHKLIVEKYGDEIQKRISLEMPIFENTVKPYILEVLANLNFIDEMKHNHPYMFRCTADDGIDRGPRDKPQVHNDTTFRTILTYIQSPVSTEIMFSNKSKNNEFNAIVPVSAEDEYNSCPLFRFKTSDAEVMTLCFNDDLTHHTVPFFNTGEDIVDDSEKSSNGDDDGRTSKRARVQPRYYELYSKKGLTCLITETQT